MAHADLVDGDVPHALDADRDGLLRFKTRQILFCHIALYLVVVDLVLDYEIHICIALRYLQRSQVFQKILDAGIYLAVAFIGGLGFLSDAKNSDE